MSAADSMGSQFEDHIQASATSNVRYPNLSHYGTHPGEPGHEADKYLGYYNIAKRLAGESAGPSGEEIMGQARRIMAGGHAAGAPRAGGPGALTIEEEEEEG